MRRALAAKDAAQTDEGFGRRQEILNAAATLFARHGYNGVGVRQIADTAGILGGSLYHYFSSKRQLYLEVHRTALASSAARIEAAIVGLSDPWDRLERACSVHLAMQVDPHSVTMPMMNDHGAMKSDMRRDLIKERDRFEQIYKRLVADLPLKPEIDRRILRLSLLSLINALPIWFRAGPLSVEEVVAQLVKIVREGAEAPLVVPVRAKSSVNGKRK